MKVFVYSILWGSILSACSWNTQVTAIDHTLLLHDKSSKVWVVDKMLDGDKDYTPLALEYKEVIVFHKSGQAYFYTVNSMGKPGKHMMFWLDEEKKEMGFTGGKRNLLFHIKYLNRTKVHLIPKWKTYPYELVLIPFPEY